MKKREENEIANMICEEYRKRGVLFLGIKETAKIIGVSVSSVRRYAKSGLIGHGKNKGIRGKLQFSKEDLINYTNGLRTF